MLSLIWKNITIIIFDISKVTRKNHFLKDDNEKWINNVFDLV